MVWLRDKLYIPTAAGKVLLILDCCYAGNMGPSAPDPYLEKLKERIKFLPWCTGLRKWQPSRRYVLALPNSQDRAGVL